MHTTVFMKERSKAEQAVQESEQRYKRLLASVTDYVYSVTVEQGRPVATVHGPGCEAVTGYTSGEFVTDPFLWYRMIYIEDRPAVTAQAELVLKGEAPSPLEHRITHKDGRLRWIRNTPVPHKDDQGRLVAYDGLVSDITERKRAGQFLAVQYAVTRQLGEASTLDEALARILESICSTFSCFLWDLAAFWRVDADAQVLRCSQTWHAPAAQVEEFEAEGRKLVLASGISLPGQVWASGQPAWIADMQAVETNCPRATYARKAGIHGACGFPVVGGKACVGVIELFSRQVQPPDAQLMEVLLATGTQIGQFIERKTAEEQHRLSEARLRAILDHSPAVIHLKDTRGHYLLANRRFQQLFRLNREDIVGKSPHDLFPPDTATVLWNHDQQVLATLTPLEFEETLPLGGELRTYISVKFPLLDANGVPYAICGIATDITERKRAEIALRESQERLALVIQGSSDGIWDWDVTTNEVYFSTRWKSMLGYEDHEIENHFSAWERLLHPDDRQRALACLKAYLSGQTPSYELEHRLRHKDGSYRWILSRGVALRDAAGKPVRMAGSHVDLTAHKEGEARVRQAYAELSQNEAALKAALQKLQTANEELRATQLRLIQAAKLESVGTLAAGVAHEVKNPLQTILMGLDYLANNFTGGDGNTKLVLSDMREAVTRANTIVRELLQLSAASDFEPKEAHLNSLVERSLWLINNELVASHISVARKLAAGLPCAKLDRSRMEQVFINLFLNAIQAMSKDGVLTVATRYRRFGEDLNLRGPAFAQFKPGDPVVIAEVQDTGPGIPNELLPKIFDPFFTTKPAGVGTGLGLSVAKKIMDLHGGGIEIRNSPLGGAVVTLMLRAETGTQPALTTNAPERAPTGRPRQTLLTSTRTKE
jgi:PAS domain S-box-containing protein